jgi:hypothetical protein
VQVHSPDKAKAAGASLVATVAKLTSTNTARRDDPGFAADIKVAKHAVGVIRSVYGKAKPASPVLGKDLPDEYRTAWVNLIKNEDAINYLHGEFITYVSPIDEGPSKYMIHWKPGSHNGWAHMSKIFLWSKRMNLGCCGGQILYVKSKRSSFQISVLLAPISSFAVD